MRVMPLTSQNWRTSFVMELGRIRFSPKMPALKNSIEITGRRCKHPAGYCYLLRLLSQGRVHVCYMEDLKKPAALRQLTAPKEHEESVADQAGSNNQETTSDVGASHFQPGPRWLLRKCQLSARSPA